MPALPSALPVSLLLPDMCQHSKTKPAGFGARAVPLLLLQMCTMALVVTHTRYFPKEKCIWLRVALHCFPPDPEVKRKGNECSRVAAHCCIAQPLRRPFLPLSAPCWTPGCCLPEWGCECLSSMAGNGRFIPCIRDLSPSDVKRVRTLVPLCAL